MQKDFEKQIASYRQFANALPDVAEGVACRGTAIQSVTCKVRGRSFLFLRPGSMMLKLEESIGKAMELSKQHSGSLTVGKSGWVTIRGTEHGKIKADTLKSWIAESHRLFAGKPGSGKAKKKTIRK